MPLIEPVPPVIVVLVIVPPLTDDCQMPDVTVPVRTILSCTAFGRVCVTCGTDPDVVLTTPFATLVGTSDTAVPVNA